MKVATKEKPSPTQSDVYADIFIDEMKQETGCSTTFLTEARPAIVRLFRDVSGEALQTCLNDVRELIVQQAETERVCERARDDARVLEQLQGKLSDELKSIRRQVIEIRDALQVTAFSLLSANNITPRA